MTDDIKNDGRLEKPLHVFVEHPGLSPEAANSGIMSLVPTLILTDDQLARVIAGCDETNDWQRSGPEARSKTAAKYRVLPQAYYGQERGKVGVSKAEARRRTVKYLDELRQKGMDVRVYTEESIRKFVDG